MAAKRIEDLEMTCLMATRDIRLYNKCIVDMINHGSPCEYCEDFKECHEAGKDTTIGCDEWILNSDLEPIPEQHAYIPHMMLEAELSGGPDES